MSLTGSFLTKQIFFYFIQRYHSYIGCKIVGRVIVVVKGGIIGFNS